MNKSLKYFFLIIPLGDPQGWSQLKYKNIPPNVVQYEKNQLTVEVNKSASPLIYHFSAPKKLKSVKIRFEVSDPIKFEKQNKQGEKKFDDFQIRLGLVVKGSKSLNFFERQMAPDWVLKLYDIGKKHGGISHIQFLNISSQKLEWKKREHPLNSLLKEQIIGEISKSGEYEFQSEIDTNWEVIGLWLSSDGDDTQSTYTIKIKEISFKE